MYIFFQNIIIAMVKPGWAMTHVYCWFIIRCGFQNITHPWLFHILSRKLCFSSHLWKLSSENLVGPLALVANSIAAWFSGALLQLHRLIALTQQEYMQSVWYCQKLKEHPSMAFFHIILQICFLSSCLVSILQTGTYLCCSSSYGRKPSIYWFTSDNGDL